MDPMMNMVAEGLLRVLIKHHPRRTPSSSSSYTDRKVIRGMELGFIPRMTFLRGLTSSWWGAVNRRSHLTFTICDGGVFGLTSLKIWFTKMTMQ
jgi:hypothetical protein